MHNNYIWKLLENKKSCTCIVGYACINETLSNKRPKSESVSVNRGMVKKTFLERGIEYACLLALQYLYDLEKIVHLLPSKQKREAKQMTTKQIEQSITDYKGMWKPIPKPLRNMSRVELIRNLRNFRDAWEREMGRNQDLSDERLAGETDKNLREHLTYYYSETAKNQAANWIRDNM